MVIILLNISNVFNLWRNVSGLPRRLLTSEEKLIDRRKRKSNCRTVIHFHFI